MKIVRIALVDLLMLFVSDNDQEKFQDTGIGNLDECEHDRDRDVIGFSRLLRKQGVDPQKLVDFINLRLKEVGVQLQCNSGGYVGVNHKATDWPYTDAYLNYTVGQFRQLLTEFCNSVE